MAPQTPGGSERLGGAAMVLDDGRRSGAGRWAMTAG